MLSAIVRAGARLSSIVTGGSGSTLIVAEKVGRVARLIEYDPLYCDTIVRRWESLTGKRARLSPTGQVFEEVADERMDTPASAEVGE
jgi:hypothetical protein